MEVRFYVFTNLSTNPTHSVGTPRAFASRHHIFRCTFLPASLRNRRSPTAPSFAARRKIEEKGVPRRRKLHILRFAFRGKSSVVPLCPEEIPLGDSSSPHQTHFVGLWRGPCWRPLESPGVNVLVETGRALCEPFCNGACDAIKSRMACSALLPCALRAALPRLR